MGAGVIIKTPATNIEHTDDTGIVFIQFKFNPNLEGMP